MNTTTTHDFCGISSGAETTTDYSDFTKHQSVVGEIRDIGKQMNDSINKSGLGCRWWMLLKDTPYTKGDVNLAGWNSKADYNRGKMAFNTPTPDGESESDEEELPGDLIAGATDPKITITYTMAGGGSHWWNYEVHFKDGEQTDVYINNTHGKFRQRNQILYYHDDQPDQVRLEDRDFSDEKWHELVRY